MHLFSKSYLNFFGIFSKLIKNINETFIICKKRNNKKIKLLDKPVLKM